MHKAMVLHATCVAIDGKGVLLAGPSGAGKSDVALRLIDGGAVLVADDQTLIHRTEGGLSASPPDSIAGMIEVRHVGLLKLPFVSGVPLALYVELTAPAEPLERLPAARFYSLLEHPLRWLKICGADASTPAKIRMALQGTFHDAG